MVSRTGLLYKVKLNKTSFEQNPGRINLPAGKYVAEIREGIFNYNGYGVDAEILYIQDNKKKKIKFMNLGRFDDESTARDVYQGMTIEFHHGGGEILVYNPKPANQCFGKLEGNVDIAIWDGSMFGSIGGNFEPQEYNPKGTKNVLMLVNDPVNKPYLAQIKANVRWQRDLTNLGDYNLLIVPPESFSFLYKIRDNDCLDTYIKSGGNVYFIGASLYYLNYLNDLPLDLPWYMGQGQYNSASVVAGDVIVDNNNDLLRFVTDVTIPIIKSDNCMCALRRKINNEMINIGGVMKRIQLGSSKISWSSYFLLKHDYTYKWNDLVHKQIDWLLQ